LSLALPGNVLTLYPQGVTDALSGSNAPRGSMAILSDLIPDPTTRHLWQCRPAAVILTNIAIALPGSGAISVILNIGTRIYGMIASGTFAGYDQPFCYDIATNTVIPITGGTAANLPRSPPVGGPWTPPSMALCGSQIVISHPGYFGAVVALGAINTLSQNALTYQGTNTTPNALIFPPSWVVNFNGRIFFLVNPPGQQSAAYMSDSLNALSITNANQILTFGDNLPLTVAAGLGLSNQLIGGVVQALIIFKGVSAIYQVTGDYALGNLAVNALNAATGTFAANTVVSTEKGILFMAPDGVRLIDLNARVADPIGKDGQGVTVPFINAVNPTRANAAYNAGLYRIQMQNGAASGNPQQEWWYDLVRDLWSGPHTTGAALMVPYKNTFICTLQSDVVGSKLFQSDQVQTGISTFVENGRQLKWQYQTTMFPEDDAMNEFCTIETTVHIQLPPTNNLQSGWSSGWSSGFGSGDFSKMQFEFIDQNLNVLDTVYVVSNTAFGSLWGVFVWGVGLWGGAADNLFPRPLQWHYPIVYRRGAILGTGLSSSILKLGEVRARVQSLGYLQPSPGSAAANAFVLDQSVLGGNRALG
jgi:hypothetical protein